METLKKRVKRAPLSVLAEIKGDIVCGKRHETCVTEFTSDAIANQLVGQEIEKCILRCNGLNINCAHGAYGADSISGIKLLLSQNELLKEGSKDLERLEYNKQHLENHIEIIFRLDNIRAQHAKNIDYGYRIYIYNRFLEICKTLQEHEKQTLLFSEDFAKELTSDVLDGAIKVRELILGKKVIEIRDYILEKSMALTSAEQAVS